MNDLMGIPPLAENAGTKSGVILDNHTRMLGVSGFTVINYDISWEHIGPSNKHVAIVAQNRRDFPRRPNLCPTRPERKPVTIEGLARSDWAMDCSEIISSVTIDLETHSRRRRRTAEFVEDIVTLARLQPQGSRRVNRWRHCRPDPSQGLLLAKHGMSPLRLKSQFRLFCLIEHGPRDDVRQVR